MKKITLLFCLLITSLGFSQVVLEDFEGDAPPIRVENAAAEPNEDGTLAAIVADPVDVNGNVLEFITDSAGVPWQQAELTLQGDYIDLTTSNDISVDVYSEAPVDVLIKLVGGVDPANNNNPVADTAGDAIHPGGGWATLTFDFDDPQDGQGDSSTINGIYGKVFFFNLWNAVDGGSGPGAWSCGDGTCPATTLYFDNITAFAAPRPETCFDGILNNGEEEVDCGGPNCDACPGEPATAAPTQPFRAGENVRSIFCSDYTNIAIDTYDTTWCGATTNTVMIEGRPTQLITGLGCEGIEFVTGRFDATEFPFFHMDIWTDTPTMDKSFNFKFSNWTGGTTEANALEYSMTNASTPVPLPSTNPGTWISIDLQLSDFNGIDTPPASDPIDVTDFVQFIITSDLGNVYYDNLYLHNNNLSVDEFSQVNISVYPNPTLNVWNVKTSAQTINSIQVFDILGKQVLTLNPNTQDAVIDASTLNSGLYFAKVNSDAGTQTLKLVRE